MAAPLLEIAPTALCSCAATQLHALWLQEFFLTDIDVQHVNNDRKEMSSYGNNRRDGQDKFDSLSKTETRNDALT
jgi:hypothetical protein